MIFFNQKNLQVENLPLKHQSPNLESIMFEFPCVTCWVNFHLHLGEFDPFFPPNLKDPFVWTESDGFRDQNPHIIHTLQLSGSTKFELSQRRLVTFQTQLWAIQWSKFGTQTLATLIFQSSSYSRSNNVEANPEYISNTVQMNTS